MTWSHKVPQGEDAKVSDRDGHGITKHKRNPRMAKLNARTPEHLHHKILKTKTTATLNTRTKSLTYYGPMTGVGTRMHSDTRVAKRLLELALALDFLLLGVHEIAGHILFEDAVGLLELPSRVQSSWALLSETPGVHPARACHHSHSICVGSKRPPWLTLHARLP